MRNDNSLELRFVEEGAAIEHERWSAWQSYMHGRCTKYVDGSLTIPRELVDRWERQIATQYGDLSEDEKDSDREQVRRYLPLVVSVLTDAENGRRDDTVAEKVNALDNRADGA